MQGELFSAEIVRFPVDGYTLLVRRTARRLIELEGKKRAADKFWISTCLAVKAEAGGSEADGQAAMDSFAAAVIDEMQSVIRHERRRA